MEVPLRMAAGFKGCSIAAGVLAGGRGRRFGGRPKGLLKVAPGISILERQMAELITSGIEEVIILANDPRAYRAFGPNIVPDLRRGIGPLGGIESAVSYFAHRCKATLFLPCDMPGITARQIKALKESFLQGRAGIAVATIEGASPEPLCAVVDNDLLPAIRRAIDQGRRKVGEVWQNLDAIGVSFSDPAPFFNVNTPLDLARWLSGQGRQRNSAVKSFRCQEVSHGLQRIGQGEV